MTRGDDDRLAATTWPVNEDDTVEPCGCRSAEEHDERCGGDR